MTFYGTFGSGHLDGAGLHCYVTIEAPDMTAAREAMHKRFNNKYAFVYDERGWTKGAQTQAELYNLRRFEHLG